MKSHAFTLIELLVVVLIVGILVAIALAQYQKAVEKSKATQAFTMLKSVYDAAQVYYLANGIWPESFDDLDVQVPWTGNTKWNTYTEARDVRSNEQWSVQLINGFPTKGVEIGRISGPYAGTGFGIYYEHAYRSIPEKQVVCLEKNSRGNFLWEDKGTYCEKIFAGTKVYGGENSYTFVYQIP
ncbi:MAG: prepilin-type N-terminal cleavage/methylation domain-containing protein [Elusimicrobiaceae bacterium]|nr:prepilin-type N-terminal cleavage/methylation domain-containing protein [Elusimicrobiaceae bacterium]